MKKNNNKHFNQTSNCNHTVLPEVDVPQVKEPRPVCKICGEPIDAIIEAISEENGAYSHFDCVINKIKETHKLAENECISYIGQGSFAICIKDENENYTIKERIPYESVNSYSAFKKFVEESKQ